MEPFLGDAFKVRMRLRYAVPLLLRGTFSRGWQEWDAGDADRKIVPPTLEVPFEFTRMALTTS